MLNFLKFLNTYLIRHTWENDSEYPTQKGVCNGLVDNLNGFSMEWILSPALCASAFQK